MSGPSPKRILVVEDDQPLRDLYVQILTDSGFSVDWAADGRSAYQALLKGGYDLVLLDIILPEMDGLKILQKLRSEARPEKPNRIFVALSNLGQEDVIGTAISLGVTSYMIKSDYTPDQIIKQINYFLEFA